MLFSSLLRRILTKKVMTEVNESLLSGLITNFHLPQSSLFLLICALIGTKTALDMYNYAIENKYRFYSYGDACFLLNKNYG